MNSKVSRVTSRDRLRLLLAFIDEVSSKIPEYLQIVTFSSFTALIIDNAIVNVAIFLVLLTFYNNHWMSKRGNAVVNKCVNGQESRFNSYDKLKLERTVFLFELIFSGLLGSMVTLISLAIGVIEF